MFVGRRCWGEVVCVEWLGRMGGVRLKRRRPRGWVVRRWEVGERDDE